MGAMSKLGGCCSFFGSVLTNKRRRLRLVVVLTAVRNSRTRQHVLPCGASQQEQASSEAVESTHNDTLPCSNVCSPWRSRPQVLEITTAALAAQEAAKLKALVESDAHLLDNVALTDEEKMGYTLLVCNCVAELVVVVIHIAYSFVRAAAHGAVA